MKLKDLISLLKKTKNKPYVLESSAHGGKVVVAPSLVGRVMGSSLPYARNNILGWINRPMIEKMRDPVFNNVGGEERFWLAPEAGQFGLNFGRNLNGWPNYKVQKALSKQPFRVLNANKKSITIRSIMKLENASGTNLQVEISRTIQVMNSCPYSLGYGDKVKFVGFESDNTIKNISSNPIKRETGPLGIWCLGQFLAKPKSVVIVPFRPSSNSKPIREDYFKDFCINGTLAKNAWTVKKNFALFKADGSHRTKIGVGPKEALPYLAGIDLDSYELIIVDYDFYPSMEYAASYWRKLTKPYDGDAICVAIDGPEKPDGPKGLSYELETLSPALFLQPNESFTFRNRTFHIFGPTNIIDNICQKFLGVDIKMLRHFERTSRG